MEVYRPTVQLKEPLSRIGLNLEEFSNTKLRRFKTTPHSQEQGWIEAFLMSMPKRNSGSILSKMHEATSLDIDASIQNSIINIDFVPDESSPMTNSIVANQFIPEPTEKRERRRSNASEVCIICENNSEEDVEEELYESPKFPMSSSTLAAQAAKMESLLTINSLLEEQNTHLEEHNSELA